MANKPARKALEKLLRRRRATEQKAADLENRIFKLESAYLQLTAGMPITRNIEYYLSSKMEKKKPGAGDSYMVFASKYPRPKDTSP